MHCAKKYMGKEDKSDNEFFIENVKDRTGLTQAVYYVSQLRSCYFLEDYEGAYQMVFCY
jgi:hypothetical protein